MRLKIHPQFQASWKHRLFTLAADTGVGRSINNKVYGAPQRSLGNYEKNTRSATHFWVVGLNLYLQVDQQGIKG